MSRTRKTARQTVRCAVYTRKSTEEGLDQDFNSLDAQRESARAYIKSQAAEGWMCLSRHYDDGGFTGGNMDRPALHQRHRQEVTLTSRDPAAAVVGETAPRHHAVQMGWNSSFWPQVCKMAVKPIWAPKRFGSAVSVNRVCAAVANNKS